MKKLLFIFLFLLTLEFPESMRELGMRRLNGDFLQAQHEFNSTTKIEILKSLSVYDYSQAVENAGKLFIRDKIIHQ